MLVTIAEPSNICEITYKLPHKVAPKNLNVTFGIVPTIYSYIEI